MGTDEPASPHSVRYCKQYMKITLNWVDLSLPLRGPITVQFKPYFVHKFGQYYSTSSTISHILFSKCTILCPLQPRGCRFSLANAQLQMFPSTELREMCMFYTGVQQHDECTIVTPNPSGDVKAMSATALHLFVMEITVGYVLYRLQAALCGA
jgi:hypothetical protein